MRALLGFALAAGLCQLATAEDRKPDPAADLKALVGKWSLEKAELGGKDVLEHLKSLQFEIHAGGKYTAKVGEELDEGSFTVDPSKKPAEMDIKSNGGPNKGRLIPAIYKLDGDQVTICYELGGGARPKKFESLPDTKGFLAVYKRKK